MLSRWTAPVRDMDITSISHILEVLPEARIAAVAIAHLLFAKWAMRLGVEVAVELSMSFDELLVSRAGRSLEAQFVAVSRLLIFSLIFFSFLVCAF